MDQAKASLHCVETMDAGTNPLRGTAPPWRGAQSGGSNCRKRPRSLADKLQSRARHCPAQRLLRTDRPRLSRPSRSRIINRTAVYGPVRTVVWEGRSREAPPYPDSETGLASLLVGLVNDCEASFACRPGRESRGRAI